VQPRADLGMHSEKEEKRGRGRPAEREMEP
jgi:hypothetical protein